jgi:uncharacterized protein YjaG (DUF416 family)
VIVIAFQSAFCAEMYQNDVFFKKNYFWDQRIKIIQNILKKLTFNKNKLNFEEYDLNRISKHSKLDWYLS